MLVMAPVKQTDSVLNLLKERMVSLEGYTGLILILILLKNLKFSMRTHESFLKKIEGLNIPLSIFFG